MGTPPIDLSKFRKQLNKSNRAISEGFHDPSTWLNTGCYALNYLISDSFTGGIPLEGKMTMFAGDSGSGKSYICSGNLVKEAQSRGVFPVLFDSENALDESWLKALGVDTSPSAIMRIKVSLIDDLAETLADFIAMYKVQNDGIPYEERGKVLLIIDSLGQLITGNNERQFSEGDQKGDMGIKAKQLTNTIKVLTAKIGSEPIGVVVTNHVYDSQDQYKPDTIPGGKNLVFSSSIIVQMNKLLLKEDEHGNALTGGEVAGIRSSVTVQKSRYAKPFSKLKINIPYDKGIDPYSGLFELFEGKGVLVKEGNRYVYTSPVTGEILKDFRKKYKANGWLDIIMEEWSAIETQRAEGVDETGVDTPDEDY